MCPAITRNAVAYGPQESRKVQVTLDPGAEATIISQKLAVALGLKRLDDYELPRFRWIGSERAICYAAYEVTILMSDDSLQDRKVTAVMYGADKEGPEILLSMHTLCANGVVMDIGNSSWRWGVTSTSQVELLSVEELAATECLIGMIGMIVPGYPQDGNERHAVRILLTGTSTEVRLPPELEEFVGVFDDSKAMMLPQNQHLDHKIDLVQGTEAPYGPMYNLSASELAVLREWLEENLRTGRIRHSDSPAGAPILFVPKKDGKLRLCVDYRALNNVTIKNRCPLPLVNETLDRLQGCKYFTTLDLKEAYHRIRIRPGDEYKTAFRTRYGHFEFLVMPFGLTNAPATFQSYINRTLAGLLDDVCVVYLDDILIYTHSEDIAEHWTAVRRVLAALSNASLYVNLKKCSFATQSVSFLGFVVTTEGIKVDPSKTKTIDEWPEPTTLKELQGFLGFANFYRRFIARYSHEVGPMTETTKGDKPWVWTPAARKAFERIKAMFTNTPILRHFDPALPVRLDTDASDFAIAAILSQLFEDGKWHPVAFMSQKLTDTERRYEVYDKELMAIVFAFKQWRHYLEGSKEPVAVYTDHDNLRAVRDVRKLSPRQARWATYLQRFDFNMYHQAGKTNPADGPSRRPDYDQPLPEDYVLLPSLQRKLALAQEIGLSRLTVWDESTSGTWGSTPQGGLRSASDTVAIASCDNGQNDSPIAGATGCIQCVPRKVARTLLSETEQSKQSFTEAIHLLQRKDNFAIEQIERIPQRERKRPSGEDQAWRLDQQNLLRFRGRVYIPEEDSIRQEIMMRCHDHPLAGHYGHQRSLALLERSYYWPSAKKDMREYCSSCAICQRTKAPRHKPYGQLSSLPIPKRAFGELTMDFITGLPPSKLDGCVYDAILVVLDRLTKWTWYIPATKTWTAKDLADALFNNVILKHGAPDGIVSDRGSLFTSDYWTEVCYRLHTVRRLSTAFHPQTDGQTERQNQSLEHYLRVYCCEEQDNWAELLLQAETAYNHSVHSSTSISPYEAVHGTTPRFEEPPADSRLEGEIPAAKDRVERIRIIRTQMADRLRVAQESQAKYYNRSHKPQSYVTGDLVLLSTRNLKLATVNKKLSPKQIGPFAILSKIGSQAYRIRLPPRYRIHDVFHVSLLEPWRGRHGEQPANTTLPDVLPDGDEVWEVEKILAERKRKGHVEYLLKWAGWDDEWNTWTDEKELHNMEDLLREYRSSRPMTRMKRKRTRV